MGRSEITILFVGVNPDDTAMLDLTREAETIQTRLHQSEHRDLFQLEQRWNAELAQLPGLLLRHTPRVLHFSGHGTADGRLYFRGADGRAVEADEASIARLFGVLTGVRCVVLNACHSSDQARSIAAHVDVVIGMSAAVEDSDAIRFAAGFYEGLGYGQDAKTAFELGRLQLTLGKGKAGEVCVLYSRPGVDPKDVFLHRTSESSEGERSQTQRLLQEVADLEREFERRTMRGEDNSDLTERLLELRRELRTGPSLAADDVLADRYHLIGRAGVGGFATVWKAYDRERKRNVAVKVLHGQWMDDRSRVGRFVSGSKRMDVLDHPAIVKILEMPREDGQRRLFFVLPWFERGDLERAVRERSVDRTGALAAVAHVLEGLAYAHERGVVHRDVKPGNILLDEHGRGAITDFDLAHAWDSTHGTKTGMGTFAYAAPEQQVDASNIDARADVYSAGMCVLFALTGEHPQPLHAAHNPAVIDKLDCCARLRSVLKRAVSYELDERTTTCLELAAALGSELEVRALGNQTDSPTGKPRAEEVERPAWATEVGSDDCGPWAVFRVGSVEQRMRWIEPGTFSMGSPETEPGRFDVEGPSHRVTLTSGFWMAETPCTQALWEAVMRLNPSRFASPRRPVEQVSWYDVQGFLARLGELVPGLSPKLPGEAQWEYACRAGTTDATYAGPVHIRGHNDAPVLDGIAWYAGNSGVGWDLGASGWDSSAWEETQHPRERSGTRECGLKRPNAWGLHDMLGNVWEWCDDGMRHYDSLPIGDPLGPTQKGWHRLRRGGSWLSDARRVRAAFRYACHPNFRYADLGFRFICETPSV